MPKSLFSTIFPRYGFSDNLGPVVYGRGEHEVFLGRDYGNTPSYSENVAAEIDNEIRSIVEGAFERAENLLKEHMDKLHLIAKYLMIHEKIDGVDFEKLMKGELTEAEFVGNSSDTENSDVSDSTDTTGADDSTSNAEE